MNRQQIQQWINEGYQVYRNGEPVKIKGDLWDYLDRLDEEEEGTAVLAELLKLDDEELKNLSL